ncbi:MAG TPA: hypothetical protein VE422_20705 [Terriglobia bacterium]|nr:hypothetical protein [Terriglobia bacterium]
MAARTRRETNSGRLGSGREAADSYWVTDSSGQKVLEAKHTIRAEFWGNAVAGSVGQLAHPFADKIAKRIKNAKFKERRSIMSFNRTALTVFVLVAGFGLPILAQDARDSGTVRGTLEVGAYTGATFGLQGALAVVCTSSGCVTNDSGKTHATVGGQFGVAAARWLWVVSDFSYTPLGSASATSRGLTSNVSGSGMTFHGALDFQPNFKRFAPFGSIGWGVFRQSADGNLVGSSVANLSNNFFSGQVGGGARVYLSKRVGIKVGVYGISAKVADTGSIANDYGRFGMFKAGVIFHSK